MFSKKITFQKKPTVTPSITIATAPNHYQTDPRHLARPLTQKFSSGCQNSARWLCLCGTRLKKTKYFSKKSLFKNPTDTPSITIATAPNHHQTDPRHLAHPLTQKFSSGCQNFARWHCHCGTRLKKTKYFSKKNHFSKTQPTLRQ
jgi:translation initiation factor 1 (eIF-1/SUI1)